MNNDHQWQALHIFIVDPAQQNKFLLDVIYPEVNKFLTEGRVSQWFFMKYWEGGPHLRVRVKNISQEDFSVLKQTFSTRIGTHKDNSALSREDFYRHNKFDGEAVDSNTLPWFEPGSVEEITYQPEFERYGGEFAMPISEQMFCASSEFAVDILKHSLESSNDKITLAFDLLLMGVSQLNPDKATPDNLHMFFTQYAKFYARFIHDIQSIDDNLQQFFENNKSLLISKANNALNGNITSKFLEPGAVDAWLTALTGTHKTWLALISNDQLTTPYFKQSANSPQMRDIALASLASSHLHMLNNRLSVVPALEYQAAKLVALTMGVRDDV